MSNFRADAHDCAGHLLRADPHTQAGTGDLIPRLCSNFPTTASQGTIKPILQMRRQRLRGDLPPSHRAGEWRSRASAHPVIFWRPTCVPRYGKALNGGGQKKNPNSQKEE